MEKKYIVIENPEVNGQTDALNKKRFMIVDFDDRTSVLGYGYRLDQKQGNLNWTIAFDNEVKAVVSAQYLVSTKFYVKTGNKVEGTKRDELDESKLTPEADRILSVGEHVKKDVTSWKEKATAEEAAQIDALEAQKKSIEAKLIALKTEISKRELTEEAKAKKAILNNVKNLGLPEESLAQLLALLNK